jgi:hypothetical protein
MLPSAGSPQTAARRPLSYGPGGQSHTARSYAGAARLLPVRQEPSSPAHNSAAAPPSARAPDSHVTPSPTHNNSAAQPFNPCKRVVRTYTGPLLQAHTGTVPP